MKYKENLCPLCESSNCPLFHNDNKRDYYRCIDCLLVFVPPWQRLNAKQEKSEYDLHENSIDDPGYRNFLKRLITPLTTKVHAPARGLDFGCGPGPALAETLKELCYEMTIYDIFYQQNEDCWLMRYDFITATEVMEHLHHPMQEISRLLATLKPQGWLAIMTKLVKDQQAFSTWHYKNDPTHVCFYSIETFQWISQEYDCNIHFFGNDVILLQKKIL